MLPIRLRVILIIAMCCYFVLILFFLKKKAISLKYTLLWIFAGAILGGMVMYPTMLRYLTRKLGIISDMNALYVMAIGFIIVILMSITSIVSKQSAKIQKLTQTIALLEKQVCDMKQEQEKT